LAPEHPDTATSLNNLARLLEARGGLCGGPATARAGYAQQMNTDVVTAALVSIAGLGPFGQPRRPNASTDIPQACLGALARGFMAHANSGIQASVVAFSLSGSRSPAAASSMMRRATLSATASSRSERQRSAKTALNAELMMH
jgi:hypothetical protein